jgi:integrase
MPRFQTGTTEKTAGGWNARWRDENGKRRRRSGFKTDSAAKKFLAEECARVRAAKNGDALAVKPTSFDDLCDRFLDQHTGEANTVTTLTWRLHSARKAFGDLRVDRIVRQDIEAWRRTLKPPSRHAYTKALSQVLNYAVGIGMLDTNVCKSIKNKLPKRANVETFTPAEVDLIAAELSPVHAALVLTLAWTGLRPEELLPLERGDIDREKNLIHVRRVYVAGGMRAWGKTDNSVRSVPLPPRVLQAIEALPPRLDTRLLFAAKGGGILNWHMFRAKFWKPALEAAGLEYRRPYDLRHSYASWSIAAGVPLFELAKHMGTSVRMLDSTYGHLTPDSHDRHRERLESYSG